MDVNDLIKHAEDILAEARSTNDEDWIGRACVLSRAKEFLRLYAGEKSSFYLQIADLTMQDGLLMVVGTVEGFIEHARSGLLAGMTPERKAQIDVVSDILEQAQWLLEDRKVHPAGPAVIVGAALEEFLRNWVEEASLSLDSKKPSLDAYCKTLREAELLTKQDVKDITSWSGIRNDAAHGEWDRVSDRLRVSVMLESVNLFMRRYGPEGQSI